MKFTQDWLQDYLDTDLSPVQIAETLTRVGLEVEDLIEISHPIAARIVECVDHPDSDHLHILTVDDGSGVPRTVVCGAPNARAGIVSALAVPGCKIGNMEIKSGKIRGVLSDGMMCSARELGIGEDHDGIMELDELNEVIGETVSALRDAPIAVFDAGITPNRPDYLAVRGVARDLAAAGVGALKPGPAVVTYPEIGSEIRVDIKNEIGCPTYRLCKISGIKNGPSNPTIAARLSAIGINPKNAPIDATNYICYDLAQPMHCFDAGEIVGNIVVRNAVAGEKFTDLFGSEHELIETDLVITDEAGILALAGVVGGMRGSVSDKTTNILLECAYFDPVTVRKTSKRIGVSTDSSYRYERGIDPNGTGYAMARAVDIIINACGGTVTENHIAGRTSAPEINVNYTPDLFLKKTGVELSNAQQKTILENLGFVVDDKSDTWVIAPTSARVDITIAEDIISELIRLYGYDNIKPNKDIRRIDFETRVPMVKKQLVERGFFELLNYGFGHLASEQLLSDKDNVKVLNPIIDTFNTARNSLVLGMLNVIADNDRYKRSNLSLFELAPVFDGSNPGQQHDQLIIARTGIMGNKIGIKHGRDVSVYDIRSDLLALFPDAVVENDDNPQKWAHPYRAGRLVMDGKVVAQFAQLHPMIAKKFGIKTPVVIGLIDNAEILTTPTKWSGKNNHCGNKIALSEFPMITRDFAFIANDNVSPDMITDAAIIADDRIIETNVFDVFDMGDGKKSIAFEIVIQPTDNVTDEELMKIQNAVIQSVENKCDAKLRG